MKKRLCLVFALVLTLAMMLSACSGGFKDVNFDGAVSAESYSNADAAVKAFLADELEGDSASLELVKYEKTADLSAEEIEALPLGEIKSSEVKSAEKVMVSYSETLLSSQAIYSAASDATKQYEIYLLTMENDEVRYFVPQAKEGDAVTKSEYDAVLNMGNFENVTIEENGTNTASGINGTTKGIIKLTKSEIYMETSTSAMDMNIVVKVYAVIENGTVKLYTYTEAPGEMADGWRKEGERDFEIDSISELFSNYANIDTAPFDMLERTNSG